MIADPERIRLDGERRVHRAARGEEARVDDVEVVDVVGLAMPLVLIRFDSTSYNCL